jgi:ELWxxDGT repeat protein
MSLLRLNCVISFGKEFAGLNPAITVGGMCLVGFLAMPFLAQAAVGGSPFYEFKVVAKLGDIVQGSDSTGGTRLSEIYKNLSVNNDGRVAFCGSTYDSTRTYGVVVTETLGTSILYHNNDLVWESGSDFAPPDYVYPQINDDNKVAVTEQLARGDVEIYQADIPGTDSHPGTTGYASLIYEWNTSERRFPFPNVSTRSEDGFIGHVVEEEGSLISDPITYWVNSLLPQASAPRVYLERLDAGCNDDCYVYWPSYPATGLGGAMVFKNGLNLAGRLVYYDAAHNRQELASTESGGEWEKLGEAPGISDDGKVIAFVGRKLDGEEGIFIHVIDAELGSGSQTTLVLGTNSIIGYDGDERPIRLCNFRYDCRIPVVRHDVRDDGYIVEDNLIIAFQATPTSASRINPAPAANGSPLLFSNREGIWTIRVDIQRALGSASSIVANAAGPLPVLQVDDWVDSPSGPKVTDLFLWDSLGSATREFNGNPRSTVDGKPTISDHILAFWARTTSGEMVIKAAHIDTDGDGLLDHWERAGGGIDMDRDNVVDLSLAHFGANVRHKDLFLEIDWLPPRTSHYPASWQNQPPWEAVVSLTNMFAGAPVDNPDGIKGITLHIDAGTHRERSVLKLSQNTGAALDSELDGGDEVLVRGSPLPGFDSKRPDLIFYGTNNLRWPLIALANYLVVESFDHIKWQYFGRKDRDARELAFRYCVIGDFLHEDSPEWERQVQVRHIDYADTDPADGKQRIFVTSPVDQTLRETLGQTGAIILASGSSQAEVRAYREFDINPQNTAYAVKLTGPPITPAPQPGDEFIFLQTLNNGQGEFQALQETVGLNGLVGNNFHSWGGNDLLVALGDSRLASSSGVINPRTIWQTIAHEMGHTMGLRHGGKVDWRASDYTGDQVWSLMSYSHQLRTSTTQPVEIRGCLTCPFSDSPIATDHSSPFWQLPPIGVSGLVFSYSWGQDPHRFDEWSYVRLAPYLEIAHVGNTGFAAAGGGTSGNDESEPAIDPVVRLDSDLLAPVLVLNQPTAATQVPLGGSLFVDGQATDDRGMEGVMLAVDVNGDGTTTGAGEQIRVSLQSTNRFSVTFTNFQGPVGARTLRVEATDLAGNVTRLLPNIMVGGSVSDSYAPEVSLLKPYVPIGPSPVQLSNWLEVVIEARDYNFGTSQYIPADSVTISFDINGDGTTNGPGETVMATPTVSNRFSVWFPNISGSTGTRYLQVRAVDKWLNVATRSFGMNVILPDPVRPVLAFISPAEGATVVLRGNLTVKVSASDNQAVQDVKVRFDGNGDGTPEEYSAYSNYDGTYSLTLTGISGPPGLRTITAVARDTALNETIVARTVNVEAFVDLIEPAVFITSPLEGAAVGTNTTLSVSFTGGDDDAVAAMSVSFDIDGDGQTTGPGETVNFNLTFLPQSYSGTANFFNVRGGFGPRVITVTATDTSAKTNALRRTVYVTSAFVVQSPQAGDRIPQSSTFVVQLGTSSTVTPASLLVRFDANGDGDTADSGEAIAPTPTDSPTKWVASFSNITGPPGPRQVRVEGAVPGSATQTVNLPVEVTDGGTYPGIQSQKLAAVPFLPETFTDAYGSSIVFGSRLAFHSPFAVSGQKLFFAASDPVAGNEPWTSDGTRRGTYLLRDIYPGTGQTAPLSAAGRGGSGPTEWAAYRGEVFFPATDGYHDYVASPNSGRGRELWASDGTTAGTRLVKDIHPRGYMDPISGGVDGSDPSGLQVFSNRLFFVAADGQFGSDASLHGRELWSSDGTAEGTSLFMDVEPGSTSGVGNNPLAAAGHLYFISSDGSKLWKSDGTPGGTSLIKNLSPDHVSGQTLLFANGLVFFPVVKATYGFQLWRSDGTTTGTFALRDFSNLTQFYGYNDPSGWGDRQPAALPDALIFAADDGATGSELWRSDGTAAGTVLVKDIWSGTNGSAPSDLTLYNGQVYFGANDRWHGRELWRTDGTEAGTVLVANVAPFNGSSPLGGVYPVTDSDPQFLTVFNGLLYFSAEDGLGIYGRELWRSDGTAEGTVLVKDIAPGGTGPYAPNSSYPRDLTVCNGELYFGASDSLYSYELWKTDGTSQGTVRVRNLSHPAGGAMVPLPNGVAFAAKDPAHGFGIWAATGDGTRFLTNGGTSLLSSAPQYLGTVSGKAVYAIQGGTVTLWATDGTPANTVRLAGSFYAVTNAAPFGNLLLFVATDANGSELWKTDGTPGGTAMVKDIYPGYGSSSPRSFFPFQGQLYFQANDGVTGIELWKTDGSSAGTVLVANLNPGAGNSSPDHFIILNNQLVFWADDGAHGREPWLADGTAAPRLIKDIWPGSTGSEYYDYSDNLGATPYEPYPRVVMNGVLYFRANNGSGQGLELWRTDGTSAGTQMVRRLGWDSTGSKPGQLTVVNNTLFFNAFQASVGNGLWKSDGTSNGTVLVKSFFWNKPSGAYGGFTAPLALKAVNCLLYFVALDNYGWELWRSDGTANGTFRLKDIMPGAGSSEVAEMTTLSGLLYFVADDGEHGRELWQTDGTTYGTQMVEDLLPGPESANPSFLTKSGSGFYYFANDGGDDLSLRQLTSSVALSFRICLTCTNSVVVSWPSLWEGWILQQNTNLVVPAGWVNSTEPISVVDGQNQIVVAPPIGKLFYRLFKP